MREIQSAQVRTDTILSVAVALRARPDVTVDRVIVNTNKGDILAGIRVVYQQQLLILVNSCTNAFCILRLDSLSSEQSRTFEGILVSAGGRLADDDDADPDQLAKLRAREAQARASQPA